MKPKFLAMLDDSRKAPVNADAETSAWWGSLWADRCELSSFGEQALAYGLSSRDELTRIAAAWRAWALQPDAFFSVLHGEILARA